MDFERELQQLVEEGDSLLAQLKGEGTSSSSSRRGEIIDSAQSTLRSLGTTNPATARDTDLQLQQNKLSQIQHLLENLEEQAGVAPSIGSPSSPNLRAASPSREQASSIHDRLHKVTTASSSSKSNFLFAQDGPAGRGGAGGAKIIPKERTSYGFGVRTTTSSPKPAAARGVRPASASRPASRAGSPQRAAGSSAKNAGVTNSGYSFRASAAERTSAANSANDSNSGGINMVDPSKSQRQQDAQAAALTSTRKQLEKLRTQLVSVESENKKIKSENTALLQQIQDLDVKYKQADRNYKEATQKKLDLASIKKNYESELEELSAIVDAIVEDQTELKTILREEVGTVKAEYALLLKAVELLNAREGGKFRDTCLNVGFRKADYFLKQSCFRVWYLICVAGL
mmetsp:Transcript_2170/g.5074  ORF Transcript_2170/g.5074 Transcript_2170/m.5074 type:complete len:400 (-) Transcript_2170:208-1407(-)|eukprot:CAMPEP_0178996272 /NCGR_PEP_ID=MMETSP0795-20121207/8284_1 /TAXON_ID=88552 /ORGANISM="Amoebophrya sp., Strain Ameob2" /LENGTH=399 /DNA_ID=CAMNT_0020688659 /DNA_START=69 /DNA_END=1268 /DNA_ORIENTATION=+